LPFFFGSNSYPNHNVRFIAINDAVDTLYGDNDFAPFRNLFNDFYAKDCSKKIRSVKRAQAERGERVGTRPPYGYKKDESNPKKIVPDPEAAEVVRHIFKLCAEGRGPKQIARQLTEEQVSVRIDRIISPGFCPHPIVRFYFAIDNY
jgi:DNA invertase Pin-like site-specific DNA recombinase